jgi:hypothetical protein
LHDEPFVGPTAAAESVRAPQQRQLWEQQQQVSRGEIDQLNAQRSEILRNPPEGGTDTNPNGWAEHNARLRDNAEQVRYHENNLRDAQDALAPDAKVRTDADLKAAYAHVDQDLVEMRQTPEAEYAQMDTGPAAVKEPTDAQAPAAGRQTAEADDVAAIQAIHQELRQYADLNEPGLHAEIDNISAEHTTAMRESEAPVVAMTCFLTNGG